MLALTLLSLLTAVVALVLAALAWRRTTTADRAEGPDAPPADVLGLRQEVAALSSESKQTFRHLAVVRYDAFGDMGGHLSWSLALLDNAGNGVVLTSIHGRSDARTYAKSVTDWTSDAQLSPEEEEAIASARPKR
ncbi:DUF4446 family protein [Nocardioides sp. CER19]|uniref:DUF4446 family protein n=1 Tax=Nocardioides sp. CER19 TaxID=3038538 RepID=UPI00244AA8AB|nr:DUF4446 family protein [Nocardioides sp. CER19]MDH2412953.1 DUF4446 family protein [Nocardioides sp. CER19]